jgi:hypothetical protein
VLRVAYSKCERAGCYSVARLIERHGPGIGPPNWKDAITRDRPVRARVGTWNLCAAHYPDAIWASGLTPREVV